MSICERTVIFDNHGDIEVQVSGDTTRYIVCSRAVSRMSPVLRSQTRQDSVADTQDRCTRRCVLVQLDGNDDDSLTILFNIAHAHFLAVPRTLDIKQMYSLSTLTSRYKCTSILDPWVESWIAGVEGTVRRDDMAMMLWVLWKLGFSDNFCTMAHRVTVELDALFEVVSFRGARRPAALPTGDARHDGIVTRCGWLVAVARVYSKLVAIVSHNHMGCEFGQFWCQRIQDAMNAQLDQISSITKEDET
ncbi:hypothetical protein BM221_001025 [Beauveria bassiana]|uniref:Nuclear pore protein n=1 Tax=Beauveria bassiana TaxID=176275 RepID=A0A2N6P240_BEABA|nr:hypothetical protein BM221_001025 [Beauveria bassiana]